MVEKVKAGKTKSADFLMGQVMRETKGRAKPDLVRQLILMYSSTLMARFPGRRVIVALGLIFSLVVVTLLGLHYHIRTIAISTEISRLTRDLRVLKRDNRRMLVDILQATSLS